MGDKQIVQLEEGSTVDRWLIEKKLGQGGFGAVYLVTDQTGRYALKTESADARVQILKMEVYVLLELEKRNNRHFCKIEDKGRHGPFNYLVMTLVGKSLLDLRKALPGAHFTMGTAIGAGFQALEALEDLHEIGYLHRDIKAGNFAVGRPEANELRKLYVLDFGMCRKFVGEDGAIRRPRVTVGFRGTARYAPIACHQKHELGRKDDIESWVYMQVELTTGALPWKYITDLKQIGEYKVRCRDEPGFTELVGNCAPEMRRILPMVDGCSYYDRPPYQEIYALMRQSYTTTSSQEFPYDWEKPGGGIFVLASRGGRTANVQPGGAHGSPRTVVQQTTRTQMQSTTRGGGALSIAQNTARSAIQKIRGSRHPPPRARTMLESPAGAVGGGRGGRASVRPGVAVPPGHGAETPKTPMRARSLY